MISSWVVEWFDISWSGASAEIEPWKGFIECTRTNGEKVFAFFESTANVPVDMTGTKKVYIVVDQSKLDDGSENAENGTGIASITTDPSAYPPANYIPLYDIVSDAVTDDRSYIGLKSALLNKTDLTSLINNIVTTWNVTANAFFGDGSNLTWLSAEVQSTSLNLMLGWTGIKWNAYSQVAYDQTTWGTSNDIWSTAQPMVSQSFFAQSVDFSDIILSVKTVSSPSDNIYIEIQTDNAGVPSGTVVTNGTSNNVPYTSLTGSFADITFTFASVPELTEGTKYHAVVKRTGATDAVNYYAVESAWSDVQIGTMSKNTWSWANATDDLYFIMPTWYELATLWWDNFVGICQLLWSAWEIVKFNTLYDANQTWLTRWSYYWYNITTWTIESWWNFKAISETELLLWTYNSIFNQTLFWDWSDGDLYIANWETITLDENTVYNYSNVTIENWWTLTTNEWWELFIKCSWIFTNNWIIDVDYLAWSWTSWSFVSKYFDISYWTAWNGWAGWDWDDWNPWSGWSWTNGFWWGGWGWGSWQYAWSGWAGWAGWYPWWLGWAGWSWNWDTWQPWWNSAGWGGWWRSPYAGWDAYSNNWQGWTSYGCGWAGWAGWIKWGACIIQAFIITWNWTITAKWWNWWNGWASWDRAGWGGWGWGWAGWIVWILTSKNNFTWTIVLTWWSWWTAWAGQWGSPYSQNWWNWWDWNSQILLPNDL